MKTLFKHIITAVITWEARVALRRHEPRIVAVTGNVGKTSTKDAVYAVVSSAFSARKSEKSFNSEIGLPLAILGLENAWGSALGWVQNIWAGAVVAFGGAVFPKWLVLEVGADHPGDIERVAAWLHPDIVVLTRMSPVPVHVEYFKGPEEMLAEKMHLARAVKPGGTIVVNGDDPLFMKAVAALIDEGIEAKTIAYGQGKDAAIRIVESEIVYDKSPLSLPKGQYVGLAVAGKYGPLSLKIELPGVLGRHLMYPVAAAIAVGETLGIGGKAHAAFKHFESPRGRMRLLPGLNSSVIVDDTYNSSPLAAMEALKALAGIPARGRKIAVLGDMKELGRFTEDAHKEVGGVAGETVHTLVTVGEAAKLFAVGARMAGLASDRVVSVVDSRQAGAILAPLVRAGDIILVKGSQSMRMERAVKLLLAKPEEAANLLVRQESEWSKR